MSSRSPLRIPPAPPFPSLPIDRIRILHAHLRLAVSVLDAVVEKQVPVLLGSTLDTEQLIRSRSWVPRDAALGAAEVASQLVEAIGLVEDCTRRLRGVVDGRRAEAVDPTFSTAH